MYLRENLSFNRGEKPAMTCLTSVYKNRSRRIGLTGGNHVVYRLFVPQNFGILQGYIGVSCLNIIGLYLRYLMETYEASIDKRDSRKVYDFLWKYSGVVKLEILQEGLTVREAYSLEERLRPVTNCGKDFDQFNWNFAKGGQIPNFLKLEKIELEERARARKVA